MHWDMTQEKLESNSSHIIFLVLLQHNFNSLLPGILAGEDVWIQVMNGGLCWNLFRELFLLPKVSNIDAIWFVPLLTGSLIKEVLLNSDSIAMLTKTDPDL